jgi:hypothetical protein
MLAWCSEGIAVAGTDDIRPIARRPLIPKILPLNPLFPIFSGFSTRSSRCKPSAIRDLHQACKKNVVCTSGFLQPTSRLCRQIRRVSFSRTLTPATVRDHVHLLALRAGALYVGKTKAGAMTTTQADVAVLRPSKHATEFAAQNTIRTAHDHFRHFFESSPSPLVWRTRNQNGCGSMTPTALRTSGGGTEHSVPTQRCLRREPATLKQRRGKRKWPESRGASHDGAQLRKLTRTSLGRKTAEDAILPGRRSSPNQNASNVVVTAPSFGGFN